MTTPQNKFKALFGATWEQLPPVFQKRYINRAFSNDISSVAGEMTIRFSKFMALFAPLFKALHILVPYQGENIPVTVDFCSQPNSEDIQLNRLFYFPGKPPYTFNSRMQIIKENEVVERMPMGLGWSMRYSFDGKKIIMQHNGYRWKIFGKEFRLPLEIFMGRGHAEEEAIDDNSYKMAMTMSHKLFGTLYSYTGHFTFKKLPS